MNNEKLKAIVGANSSQTTSQLAAGWFNPPSPYCFYPHGFFFIKGINELPVRSHNSDHR